MSNEVFPSLPGLTWSVKKRPEFNTKVQRSVNLSELRASFSATPIYQFTLNYDVLRDTAVNSELESLAGFFMARYGRFDSFLFTDPDDSQVTGQIFGVGDGTQVNFPLARSFGSFAERVSNLNGTPSIYIDEVLQTSGYTVSSAGVVTFSSAPAVDEVLSWTGGYYFRCRFVQDTQEFEQFMRLLWEARQVQFLGSLGTKL